MKLSNICYKSLAFSWAYPYEGDEPWKKRPPQIWPAFELGPRQMHTGFLDDKHNAITQNE